MVCVERMRDVQGLLSLDQFDNSLDINRNKTTIAHNWFEDRRLTNAELKILVELLS